LGRNYGQDNVTGWTGIVQVAAGQYYTVGLKSDGTVVAVGWNDYGQCNTYIPWLAVCEYNNGYQAGLNTCNQTIADLEAQIAQIIPGDANGDGEVNALDITKTERLIVGLE
jgi:alpha-tubulin suppressor-like RCC1 family protein